MNRPTPPEHRNKLRNVTLFTEEDESSSSKNRVPVTVIHLPNQQPRRYFDKDKMAGLVESIKQPGILEPLLVRPLDEDSYELVAGERRFRAAKELGLEEVPVVIREMNGTEAFQFALIENLQREDLNPIEETEGVLQLLSLQLQMPETEVVSLLYRMSDEVKGKVPHNVMGNSETTVVQEVFSGVASMEWQSFVANRLPLLKLPAEILESVRKGRIAYTKAQAIARVKDESCRKELLGDAIPQNLSLTQIKEKIAAIR
jgi:ParB family chromosome partitioning protein